MTPDADPAFRTAMDKLLLQVNPENVIAVGRAFRQHADDLREYLRQVNQDTRLWPCGGDPVSQDVLKSSSITGKINQLIDVHWNHFRELEAVANNLEDVAKSYGFTDAEIADSMREPAGTPRHEER